MPPTTTSPNSENAPEPTLVSTAPAATSAPVASTGCTEDWIPPEWSPKRQEKFVRFKELRDAPMPAVEPIFSADHLLLPTVAAVTLISIGVLAWKKERFINSAAAIALLASIPTLWGLMTSIERLIPMAHMIEQTNFLPLDPEDDADLLLFAIVDALRPLRLGLIYSAPCLLLAATVTSLRALRCGQQVTAK